MRIGAGFPEAVLVFEEGALRWGAGGRVDRSRSVLQEADQGGHLQGEDVVVAVVVQVCGGTERGGQGCPLVCGQAGKSWAAR